MIKKEAYKEIEALRLRLSETILNKRREKLLSQIELAEQANTTQSTICHLEQGLSQPSMVLFGKIARVLDFQQKDYEFIFNNKI
jgi:DNA-binding XRE family transcriptional regulator